MPEIKEKDTQNTLNLSEKPLQEKPKDKKTLTRVLVIVLLLVLLLAVASVIWLLIPKQSQPGTLSVKVGEETTVIEGENTLRDFNGEVTDYEYTQPEDVADAVTITYAEDMEILLKGVVYTGNEKVTVYSEDRTELSTDDEQSLWVPAEAGKYLVRFDILWGTDNNYVATQYYIWLDVLSDAE